MRARTRNRVTVFRSGNLAESVLVEARLPQRGSHRVSVPANRERGDRLDSWKEIAAHLKRTIRTVQRWEKREGLPVHGHFHVKGRTVYALKEEIDFWLTARGRFPVESSPMQRRSRRPAKMLNPPPRVMKQMFAAVRLWVAMAGQESFRGHTTRQFADPRMSESTRATLTQIQKSERNADARQFTTHHKSRQLSLAVAPSSPLR